MQDRVPLYPGRVTLTPVSGQANTFDLLRADQPTQEGTPLNKASLLKDTTAALFGLGTDAVPDDVFAVLSRFHKGLGNEYVWAKSDDTGIIGYVNSPDPYAYPIDDGYTYTALGQLGSKTQIATGSYTGTGTYGASNPNSLTFDFEPKLVIIRGSDKTESSTEIIWFTGLSGEKNFSYLGNTIMSSVNVSLIKKTFYYYAKDQYAQNNISGNIYYYIAIG